MPRKAITEFDLANALYKGASVTFWTVVGGAKSNVKAPLFADSTSANQLANPQKLDSRGKFRQSVYHDVPVIGTIEGLTVPTHDTGIIAPAPTFRVSPTGEVEYSFDGGVSWNASGEFFFRPRGEWSGPGTAYERNDLARNAGSVYVALSDHSSAASFATDLAAGKWQLFLKQLYPFGPSMINGQLDWTVPGDNTLRLAIKTLAGNDPSVDDPVFVWTHPVDPLVEPPVLVEITSSTNLSITVPQGATLGSIANLPLRLYGILAVTSAGVPHLAIINCVNINDGVFFDDYTIRALRPGFEDIDTVALGVGSDLAEVFYSTAGVNNCQYAVLGHATWDAGLATAGVWNTSTSAKRLYMQGHPLPGEVINETMVQSGGTATGTTTIPLDDTVPEVTEGDEYASVFHTGHSPANLLDVSAHGVFSHTGTPAQLIGFLTNTPTGGAKVTIAVGVGGRSASADALCAISVGCRLFVPVGAGGLMVNTITLRVGASVAGTTRRNGAAGARLFGGGMPSWVKIKEIMT